MKKIFLIFVLVALVVLTGLNVYLTRAKPTIQSLNNSAVIPPVEASQLTQVDSPDGKLTLMMKTIKNKSETTYSFSVSGKEIFVKTLDPATTISIPGNTWSPDNKYLFLKEENVIGVNFFALSATILSSDQNDQTANITDLFAQKYPDLKIGDVTGWGGINLIIVNSVKEGGDRGPSFWFSMPGGSFTQLSTLF